MNKDIMAPEDNGKPIVCVFGSYSPQPGSALWDQAYAIGNALARAGYTVANGGYDGTMHASAKGAKDAGGSTIGVTCSVFNDYRGKSMKANPCIDREICHKDLLGRIEAMMHMSAAYVILEGGTGTLSELAIVWEYVCKGLVSPRPIFVVGEFWRPVVQTVRQVRPKHCGCIHEVTGPEEIVSILKRSPCPWPMG